MRALLIHAKEFMYRVREKAINNADSLDNEIRPEYRVENGLVAFISIEEGDNGSKSILEKFSNDVLSLAGQLKVKTIVIYPYAHLSDRLAGPLEAKEFLSELHRYLSNLAAQQGIEVVRAPFGWYKEFKLHCYGHPLSELSRGYKSEEEVSVTIHSPQKEYVVVDPSGNIYTPEEYLSKADPDLRILIEKEALGKELGEVETEISKLCSKFGFEWEPFSDYGHMRYEPHAAFIVEAVSDYAWRLARSLSFPVLKVRGTNMFDLAQPAVYEHARLFGDRLYTLSVEKKKLVLRYAACHQQFAMLRNYVLSYRDLPLGMFEVADSYRLEQSGEVSLCFRLRKFLMPDLHVLVSNIEEAMKVAEELQSIIHREAKKLGRRYVAVYNVTRDFWENNRDMVVELIRRDGRPALIAIYPAGIYYWVVNVEYHIIDHANRPREVATFQFDIGNAKRFGIKYTDENGREKYPVIIHTALIGSIERYIYMVFDTALREEMEGRTPSLPVWLSPIQVRIIPVNPRIEKQIKYSLSVAEALEASDIRVDIDNRELGLGRRIRDAAREWIPYIVVIGDREVETNTVNVTIRKTNDRIALKVEELVQMISEETRGYPKLLSTLPRYVSKRPSLVYLEKSISLSSAEGSS